jgi:hypothetical protein
VDIVQRRPAECGTAAFALAFLVAYVAGVRDEAFIVALAVVIGAVPGAITWLVELGRKRR